MTVSEAATRTTPGHDHGDEARNAQDLRHRHDLVFARGLARLAARPQQQHDDERHRRAGRADHEQLPVGGTAALPPIQPTI